MNNIFKLAIVITLLGLFSQSCRKGGPWGIKGKGTNITKTIQVSHFDEIELSLNADIYYTQDSIYKVEVTGQENILAVLGTEVDDHELEFDFRRNVWQHNKLKIVIHSPDLRGIKVSGSGSFNAQAAINTSKMEMEISGSGNVYIPALTATKLEASISGSGNAEISGGAVTSEKFSISGSGNMDVEELVAVKAECEVSGSGDIRLHATESLDVKISGSGSVSYKGNPEIDMDISGSGKLTRIK